MRAQAGRREAGPWGKGETLCTGLGGAARAGGTPAGARPPQCSGPGRNAAPPPRVYPEAPSPGGRAAEEPAFVRAVLRGKCGKGRRSYSVMSAWALRRASASFSWGSSSSKGRVCWVPAVMSLQVTVPLWISSSPRKST